MSLIGKLQNLNLRMKFILPIAAMLVFSMAVIGGYLVKRQSDSFYRELGSSSETMLRLLAINSESGVLFESTYELDEILKAVAQFEGVEYASVHNIQGDILSHLGEQEVQSQNERPDSLLQMLKDNRLVKYDGTNYGTEVLIIFQPITTEKKVLNREHLGITGGFDNTVTQPYRSEVIGYIELGVSLSSVHQAIVEATTATIIVTALIVISAIMILTLVVNAMTRPITGLVNLTNQIAQGDLSQKVEVRHQDEIGQLGGTFNKMIESLKQSRDEIEQYNRNLEEKIIERTQQLEQAQAQLVQSEKLSAIGQLAAGVAHELNNPLGGILGYAQFTLEKLSKNLPENTSRKEIDSYVRYVTDIEAQARRCKTIVQNLLRFSRSSQTLDLEEVDINKTVEETVSFVGHQLKLSQIGLEVSLDPNLPMIQGNAGQLQQVFTNLIINGMHASEPDSIITIVSRFSPALGEFGGAVELLFVDHGCGIKEEDMKKIFEPFFTTKEIGKGTGLGLSVSYGIIKAHQGEITVTSKTGEGTTFTIILPVQKPVKASDIVKDKLY